MWYWNRENFEGLAELARHFTENPKTVYFGEHLRLREQGLRQKSFVKLNSFLEESSRWSDEEKRTFVNELLTVHYHHPGVHQLLSTPLIRSLILPTLEKWMAEQSEAVEPKIWMGMLEPTGSLELFQQALLLDPKNPLARELAVRELKRRVEYGAHHLPDTYLGDPTDTLAELDQIEQLDPKHQPYLSYHRKLIASWQKFKEEEGADFGTWCKERGLNFQWGKTFYYGA